MSNSKGTRQFHLSTAIVMMLVAGAMIGLNLWRSSPEKCLIKIDDAGSWDVRRICRCGWPFQFVIIDLETGCTQGAGNPLAAPIDVMVGIDALFITGCVLETSIRRSKTLWVLTTVPTTILFSILVFIYLFVI